MTVCVSIYLVLPYLRQLISMVMNTDKHICHSVAQRHRYKVKSKNPLELERQHLFTYNGKYNTKQRMATRVNPSPVSANHLTKHNRRGDRKYLSTLTLKANSANCSLLLLATTHKGEGWVKRSQEEHCREIVLLFLLPATTSCHGACDIDMW